MKVEEIELNNLTLKKRASKKYYIKHREEILKKRKEFYWNNHEEMIKRQSINRINFRKRNPNYYNEWYQKNIEKRRLQSKGYYLKNRERRIESYKKYKNSEKGKKKWKEYYKKNRERILEKNKNYFKNEKNLQRKNQRKKERKKNDINFKIKELLSNSFNRAIMRRIKNKELINFKRLNYSLISLKLIKELPKDFYEREYHIDHIKPLCSFDLTKDEEIKKAFTPENHQWLLKSENLSKASKDKLLKIKINS